MRPGAQEFQADVDQFQYVQPLRVKTAFALSETQQKDLQTKLESWLKSKVRMDVQVDPQRVLASGKTQLTVSVPGQIEAPHTPVPVSPQAARAPWGAPVTAVHRPKCPPTSHAQPPRRC